MSGRCRGERGVIIPLVGLMLVVLLGMTAFAIDLGLAFNQRRQNQSAADVAALSGAYAYGVEEASSDEIFDEVVRISHESLDPGDTLEEWSAAFRTCRDDDHLAKELETSAGEVECISYAGRRFRVKLPETTVPSIFRASAGFGPISTTASAVVEVTPGETNILPFAMSQLSAADSTLICLKTPPSGFSNEECDGPSTGRFNDLNIPRPYDHNTNQACDGGHQSVVRANTAMGLDHELARYTGGAEVRDECTNGDASYPNPPGSGDPNTVNASSGNQPSNVEYGLLTSTPLGDGRGGRLTRTPFATADLNTTWKGIDDTPLWDFIGDFSESQTVDMATAVLPLGPTDRSSKVPRSCWLLAEGVVVQNKAAMRTCMDHYDVGQFSTDLFTADTRAVGDGTYDLQESPRFAWLPMAGFDLETDCGTGSTCWYRIEAFRPVFVQTLYWGKSQSGSFTSERLFNPGEAFSYPIPTNKQFGGASSFTFNLEMLPDEVLEQGYYRTRPDLGLVE